MEASDIIRGKRETCKLVIAGCGGTIFNSVASGLGKDTVRGLVNYGRLECLEEIPK